MFLRSCRSGLAAPAGLALDRAADRSRSGYIQQNLTFKTQYVVVLVGIEAALVRAEGRIAFGAAWRTDATVKIVRHSYTCESQGRLLPGK